MPVQQIYFDHLTISAVNGYVSKDARDINFKNVKLVLPDGRVQELTGNVDRLQSQTAPVSQN